MRAKTAIFVLYGICAACVIAKARVRCLARTGSRESTPQVVPSSKPSTMTSAAPPPMNQVALEPMTAAILTRRSAASFPDGYLTFMGIIQGVALGSLVAQAVRLLIDQRLPDLDRLAVGGQVVAGFTAIIVVTYEYLWFTTLMRWSPTFTDTLVPYTLGAGEVVLPLLMGRNVQWWTSLGLFLIAAIVALRHTTNMCTQSMFLDSPSSYHTVQRLLNTLIAYLILQLVACAAVCAIIFTAQRHELHTVFIALAPWMTSFTGAGMVVVSERGLDKIYSMHGVPRRRRIGSSS